MATSIELAYLLIMRPDAYRTIKRVQTENITYLESAALLDLYMSVTKLESETRFRIMIEAGCALGGSALVLASAKNLARLFYIYDNFEMIPPPS